MKVKICCISSIDEAELALSAGADAIGLVSHMPSGPGVISIDLIAEIVAYIQNRADTFLLTSETEANKIVDQHRKVKTSTIQLVDSLSKRTYANLRRSLPDINLIQVIHVMDEKAISHARSIAHLVDAILLDSGNPHQRIKELGGTGRTHNWEISQEIVSTVDIPVWLAGGLKSQNVEEAIKSVNPYGVDLCSGVRSNGKLDKTKLEAFLQVVNRV